MRSVMSTKTDTAQRQKNRFKASFAEINPHPVVVASPQSETSSTTPTMHSLSPHNLPSRVVVLLQSSILSRMSES